MSRMCIALQVRALSDILAHESWRLGLLVPTRTSAHGCFEAGSLGKVVRCRGFINLSMRGFGPEVHNKSSRGQ